MILTSLGELVRALAVILASLGELVRGMLRAMHTSLTRHKAWGTRHKVEVLWAQGPLVVIPPSFIILVLFSPIFQSLFQCLPIWVECTHSFNIEWTFNSQTSGSCSVKKNNNRVHIYMVA